MDVLELPSQRSLASKAHDQQAEAVAVHEVGSLRSVVAVRGFRLEKHLPKIGDIFLEGINVTHHMVVTLLEVLSDLAAGCYRLAVLGG